MGESDWGGIFGDILRSGRGVKDSALQTTPPKASCLQALPCILPTLVFLGSWLWVWSLCPPSLLPGTYVPWEWVLTPPPSPPGPLTSWPDSGGGHLSPHRAPSCSQWGRHLGWVLHPPSKDTFRLPAWGFWEARMRSPLRKVLCKLSAALH